MDHPRILLRKPRIRALRNNPRIAHANLGSTRNHLGSRNQTSAIRGWSRFGSAILDDCVWIRGLRSKSADPIFACVILGLLRQSSDPRFAQQNPRMVRIRTVRLTYIYICYKLFVKHGNTSWCPRLVSIGRFSFSPCTYANEMSNSNTLSDIIRLMCVGGQISAFISPLFYIKQTRINRKKCCEEPRFALHR